MGGSIVIDGTDVVDTISGKGNNILLSMGVDIIDTELAMGVDIVLVGADVVYSISLGGTYVVFNKDTFSDKDSGMRKVSGGKVDASSGQISF